MKSFVPRLVAVVVMASMLGACTQSGSGDEADKTPAAAPDPTSTSTATPVPTSAGLISAQDLQDAVHSIQVKTDTQISVAVYDGEELYTAGSLGTLPAWSTIKVPIAMAALEHCEYKDTYKDSLVQASIEYSDNASAQTLFQCLNQEGSQTELTEDAIAKSGTRPAVDESWGLTKWSTPSQAKYGYYLSTINENVVIESMHNIAEEQSYGLGAIDGAAFKGGWSDHIDGSWHTRQFGFFEYGDTTYGVAIAASSARGSYSDGQEALTEVAEVLIDD